MIHNARVQLFATALNNLGVGLILAGLIAPLVRGGSLTSVVVWVFIGLDFLFLAQAWLGRLR